MKKKQSSYDKVSGPIFVTLVPTQEETVKFKLENNTELITLEC